MKRFLIYPILFLVLAGCRFIPIPTPPPMTPTLPPLKAELDDGATAVPSPTVIPVPTTIPSHTPQPGLPSSTIFDTAWDDRDPFQAGLIEAEQAVLQQLLDASIYHLDLQINDQMTRVSGVMDIRYTNQESVAQDAVYFHLYPNLLGGAIVLDETQVNGTAVSPTLEFNNTILRVPLAEPLTPKGQIVIHLTFITNVPEEVGRNYGILAYVDGVLALAHFYPMIAAFDDTGWNIEPAVENGDIVYADISFFLVRVTAPSDQIIVTSGIELSVEEDGGKQTAVIAAGPMRDFYLAASPDYQLFTTTVGQTTINSYATKGLEAGAATILETAAAALDIYGSHFGQYPFSEMDLVNTPNLALGIEYPGIMAITSRIYDPDRSLGNTPNSAYIEGTTAHEVGHQWFYGVVGNDQLDEPWLDESVTQYVTWLYFRERYGQEGADGFFQSLEGRWNRIEKADIPIGLPVSEYEGAEYSGIIYGRGPIFLQELAQIMGQDTFSGFFREYYTRNRWKIADTADFQGLAEQYCDCDLSDIFSTYVYGQ